MLTNSYPLIYLLGFTSSVQYVRRQSTLNLFASVYSGVDWFFDVYTSGTV